MKNNNLTEAFCLRKNGVGTSAPRKAQKNLQAYSTEMTSWVHAHEVALMGLLALSAITSLPLLAVVTLTWLLS